MGFYYYFLDVYEWCLLSLTPSSQHSTLPRWGLQGGFIGGAVVLRSLEMSLKGRMEPIGRHSACSLQGAWSAVEIFCWEMDECFTSSTWDSLHCWGKHVERSFRAERKARLSPPKQELEFKCTWKGFPPKDCVRMCKCPGSSVPPADQDEPSSCNQCSEMVCRAQRAQQFPAGAPQWVLRFWEKREQKVGWAQQEHPRWIL